MSPKNLPHQPTDQAPGVRNRWVCFFGLAIVGCLADLLSKQYVFSWLGVPTGQVNIYWLIEGYVGIETALNHGALFGLGQNKVWFFATMSFVALGGVAYWLVKVRGIDDWILTITLGLITGGILGNLYDRLGIWSGMTEFAVRDWIRLSYDYNAYVWPNFNIADSLLVCGAGLLFWHSFKNPEAAQQAADKQKLADAA